MSESALDFSELQTHIALELAVAYYGAAGDEIAQPPVDIATLQQVKNYVNGGIRMFLMDAPAEGWRFQKPVASVNLWPTTTTGVITVSGADNTILTSVAANFFPSMVGHAIVAVASGTSYIITAYTSSTIVIVASDASVDTGDTFTITADGNYTLPSTFGGEYSGAITFAASTNLGSFSGWTSEGYIRQLRQNISSQTGTPQKAAIRKMDVARRWELLIHPIPDEIVVVEFPYELYFTALTADTELHPAGAHYDEAVKAACEAYAELHGEDTLAGRNTYYRDIILPGAYRTNRRSAPRKLGNLLQGQARTGDWRDTLPRPDVSVS